MVQLLVGFLSCELKQSMLVDLFLNISLAVIGIGFTLLTVLQSFIETKKNSKQSYAKAIKEEKSADNPMIYEQEQVRLSSLYIERQKKLVKKIELVLVASVLFYVLNLYPKFDNIKTIWFYAIDLSCFVFYIIFLLCLTYSYLNLYEENVNDKSLHKNIRDKFLGIFKYNF